jgi:hypothetical protein
MQLRVRRLVFSTWSVTGGGDAVGVNGAFSASGVDGDFGEGAVGFAAVAASAGQEQVAFAIGPAGGLGDAVVQCRGFDIERPAAVETRRIVGEPLQPDLAEPALACPVPFPAAWTFAVRLLARSCDVLLNG